MNCLDIKMHGATVKKYVSFMFHVLSFVLGMRFGLLQTKIGLVSALSKYQFHICKETAVPLIFDRKSFILSSAGGIELQIKNRTKRIG